jgi:hypothetical protein
MRVMAQLDLILEEEKKGAGRRGLGAKREAKVEAKRKRDGERVARRDCTCSSCCTKMQVSWERSRTDRQKRNKVTSNLPSQSINYQ